ncbi:MAG TPA: hypothetical protein PLL10_05730, partial [Elusimicrobiales bacterium]|nr:hypothetical protein [Elusimicrobiales bacterium]
HGIDMRSGMNEAKRAVASGRWILYRFNPMLRAQGKNPLTIDSGKPTISVEDYMKGENRFRSLMTAKPEVAQRLLKMAESEYAWRMSVYQQLAAMSCDVGQKEKVAAAA